MVRKSKKLATDYTDLHGLENQAFDFETSFPEIQDEHCFQARGLQVVQGLSDVDVLNGFDGLEFHEDAALH